MPSWNDGESSTSPSILGEYVEPDYAEYYAPHTCSDPTFCGIAVGCPVLCRVHRLEPVKCVAFEGSNTGRRFYMCQVQDLVSNCGFVSWIDTEWPHTLKNALNRLWAMYYEENNSRIDDRVSNGQLVKHLSDEKNKIEKNYQTLLKKFMEETEKKMLADNYKKIMSEEADLVSKEDVKVAEKERDMLKTEVAKLKSELKELKEEKKKLEYMVYDLFKACDGLKEKVKKVKSICDE